MKKSLFQRPWFDGMSERRKFIRNLAGASLGALFLPGSLEGKDQKSAPWDTHFSLADISENDLWDLVRMQFPLTSEMHYLNAGTRGPQSFSVIETVERANRKFSETGVYDSMNRVRKNLADVFGVGEDEIALTRNATEGINIIAGSLDLKKGDEVIMTTREHVGNALPWLNRMRRTGIVIKAFTPGETAQITLDRIKSLITRRTKVIAVPHVTSPTGTILPVEEITALAAENEIFTFLDGAQSGGHINIDYRNIGCDFYAGCFHKWYLGPEGTGFLFIRKNRLHLLDPLHVGAYSDTSWEISEQKVKMGPFVDSARLFEYGTHSAALAFGAVAAMEFLHKIGMKKVEERNRFLADYLRHKLVELGPGIEILTPSEPRSHCGILGFRFTEKPSQPFTDIARNKKFRVRYVPESGLNSVRISCHIYNNESEMDGLTDLVKDFLKKD